MSLVQPTVGVIPILVGPAQALLALLPVILAAAGGAVASLLKPAAFKIGLKILWRNKYILLAVAAVVAGVMYLWPLAVAALGLSPRAGGIKNNGEWTAFRGSGERRGAGGLATVDDPVTPDRIWTFSRTDKTFYSSPALAGGSVFMTSANKGVFRDRGAIYRLDAGNGAVQWKAEPSGFRATFSSPAVGGGYVVCGEGLHYTRSARICCFKAETGALVWMVETKSHVESSPALYDGKVYVGAGDDGFYCLSVAPRPDGKQVLWHLPGSQYPDCEASPAARDGRVYFCLGMDGMAIVCCDAATGREIWRTPAPYPVFGCPTLAAGRVIVGMGNGNFIETAEQARNSMIAKLTEKGASEGDIQEARKRYGPVEGEVWCLDDKTGAVLWKYRVGRTVLGAIAHADGRLYIGSCDGALTCLDLNGKRLKSWNTREPVKTSPCVGRQNVYVLTETGRLYGFDRETLAPVMDTRIGTTQPFLSSPVVGEGHLYVGTAGEGLVCVGKPAGEKKAGTWAGALGGPGRSGWADRRPPSAQGKFAWSYPEEEQTEDPAVVSVRVSAPVVVVTNTMFAGFHGARNGLAMLSLSATGRQAPAEKWWMPTSNGVFASAAFADGRVFVADGKPGDMGRKLRCAAADSGAVQWTWPLDSAASGAFSLYDGHLLVADRTNRLVCLGWEPGGAAVPLWESAVNGPVGAPAVSEDIVLVACPEPGVMALSALNGAVLWRAVPAAPPRTGPIVSQGRVAVGTETGVSVFSLVDGRPLWSADCGAVQGTVVADGEHLAVNVRKPEVVVLDWHGKEIVRIADAAPSITPLLAGDVMLCLTAQSIKSVDLSSGAVSTWLARTGWMGPATAPGVLSDGYFYFGAANSGLVSVGPP